jgi:hypothetical protein
MAYIDGAPSTEPPSKNEKKTPSSRLRKYWREVEAYNKAAQDWHEQSDKIVKLYLDQHRTAASPRRFALLWSNIETLKPAVYAKSPNILCSRRHKDPDPIGRVAAEILERATNTTFDLGKMDERFRMVRDDRLLAARGQAWVRYEAVVEAEQVKSEKVVLDYVHWRDFGHNVAGTWADVWLVWRRVYKTRAEVRKRFGAKVADKLNYSAKTAADDDKEMGEHKACIYELWDKERNATCFISKYCPDILEDEKPPIAFRDFFPCPEPCYGSKTSKSLFPTPDYRYYQDQAQEIDDLTEKIANQCDLLAPKAFVPAGPSADGTEAIRTMIQTLQSQLTNNKTVFIPVESWAGFAEKGGSKGLVDWLPIKDHVDAIKGSIEARNQLIQDVYQITGIADVLRGQTNPNETLGAQQMKENSGARRVKNAKDEIARFCRDVGQLVAEVIAEQFQPQTLADMSGFAYVPAPPVQPGMMPGMAPQPQQPPPQSPSGKTFDDNVLQLLRDDRMRGFLIDIETDSTIQPDEDAEKQRRVEFITAFGGLMQQVSEVLVAVPEAVPIVKEVMMFGARGFRVSRNVEDTIESTMEKIEQSLQQRQQQPDPKAQAEQAKVQAEMQKMQMDAQIEQQRLELEKEKMAMELQVKQAEMQLEQQKAEAELQMEAQKAQLEMQVKQMEADHKMQLAAQEAQQKAEIAAQTAQQDAQNKAQEAATNQQFKESEFVTQQEMAAAKFHEERKLKEQDFAAEQQRKAKSFEADEKRREQSHKVETDTKVGLMKERAASEAKQPKGPKRVVVRKRDGDGKPAELEVH